MEAAAAGQRDEMEFAAGHFGEVRQPEKNRFRRHNYGAGVERFVV